MSAFATKLVLLDERDARSDARCGGGHVQAGRTASENDEVVHGGSAVFHA
jgi:hypothetical protein